MKKTLLSIIMVLLISLFNGCADKRIILVPQSQYYPTFDTSHFKESKKFHLDIWIESEEENGTIKSYIVTDEKDGLNFIKNTKELRMKYNVLLKKINEFNDKIKNLNKEQNSKKPIEVEKIDTNWYK